MLVTFVAICMIALYSDGFSWQRSYLVLQDIRLYLEPGHVAMQMVNSCSPPFSCISCTQHVVSEARTAAAAAAAAANSHGVQRGLRWQRCSVEHLLRRPQWQYN